LFIIIKINISFIIFIIIIIILFKNSLLKKELLRTIKFSLQFFQYKKMTIYYIHSKIIEIIELIYYGMFNLIFYNSKDK